MPKKSPLKYDAVEIKWLDTVSHDEGWHSHAIRLTEAESLHKTVGYFLDADEKLTHVCRSYRPSTGTIEGILAIPSGCIQSMKTIKKATDIPED